MNTLNTVIPDLEILYRYAKPQAFPEGQTEIPVGIFQDTELSCDWEHYQKKPENSFHIVEGRTLIFAIEVHEDIRNPKNPKRNGALVPDWKQDIIHNPLTVEDDPIHGPNESHSLIKGLKKMAVVQAIATHTKLYKRL